MSLPTRPARRRYEPWMPEQMQAEDDRQRDEAGLPVVAVGADLARVRTHPRVAVLGFCLAALIYIAFVPEFLRYSSPPTGDQPFYLMVTSSIVQDRDLNIANNHANHDEDKFYALAPHPANFVGMSAPYPVPVHPVVRSVRPPSEIYDFHHPGLPALLAPAWIVGGLFQYWWPATVVFMCLVAALVSVNMLLLAHEVTGSLWVGIVIWLVVAFSHPLMTYAYLIFTELTAGLLVIYAFRRLAMGWAANGPWRLALVGLCIGYLPWLQWRYVALAVPLLIYAGVQVVRAKNSEVETQYATFKRSNVQTFKRSNMNVAFFLAPVVVSAGLLLAYHYFLFGRSVPPLGVPEIVDPALAFHWPWEGMEEASRFIRVGFAHLYDQQFGLLIYAPVFLLVAAGVVAMVRLGRRADRRLLAAMFLVVAPTALVITSFEMWNGSWGPPSRFLTTITPLVAAPLAMAVFALRRNVLFWTAFVALALPGPFFALARLHQGHNFWPHRGPMTFFEYLATWHDLAFKPDLRGMLPSFIEPHPHRFPITTGVLIGASALITLVFGTMVRRRQAGADQNSGVDTQSAKRKTQNAIVGLWLVTLLVLAGGWLVMNAPYLEPSTVLAQQGRWNLQPPLLRAYGIAHMAGKVYVSDYGDPNVQGAAGNGLVGELDPATGVYNIVQPRSQQGPLTYEHPGAIEAGPGGLLYVLNNSSGKTALWVMRPDGEVVQRIPLDQTTGMANSLAMDAGGSLYVGDQIAGKVFKYGPQGGQPVSSWGGMRDRFNSPSGVAIAPNGTLYVSEGLNLVQALNREGKFLQAHEMEAQPTALAVNGKWLDIGCVGDIVSLDTETGQARRGRFVPESAPWQLPTGMTYASDGTLYIIEGSVVTSYRVEH